jgi:hypothetical protein
LAWILGNSKRKVGNTHGSRSIFLKILDKAESAIGIVHPLQTRHYVSLGCISKKAERVLAHQFAIPAPQPTMVP